MTAPSITRAKIAKQFTLTIPSHWLCAIINGDESSFDYSNDQQDYEAYQAFCECEIPENAILDPADIELFMTYHDAKPYGVLACNVTETLVTVYA